MTDFTHLHQPFVEINFAIAYPKGIPPSPN